MHAIIVARAGPFAGPDTLAADASVEVQEPGHASLLRSQTIVSTGNEINKSPVAQILKLLPYLRLYVLIARIEIAKVPLESIDLVKGEITLAE
jgi:hypothetical protein